MSVAQHAENAARALDHLAAIARKMADDPAATRDDRENLAAEAETALGDAQQIRDAVANDIERDDPDDMLDILHEALLIGRQFDQVYPLLPLDEQRLALHGLIARACAAAKRELPE